MKFFRLKNRLAKLILSTSLLLSSIVFLLFLSPYLNFRKIFANFAEVLILPAEQQNKVRQEIEDLNKKLFELGKQKGFENLTAQDVIQNISPEVLSILKKYYYDNGCPGYDSTSFEDCIEKILKEFLRIVGWNSEFLRRFSEPQTSTFICGIRPGLDEKACYEEFRKQLVLLPVLAMLSDKELKNRDWLMAPKIFEKEVPSTQKLAVEGIGCGLTNGNLITESNFAAEFAWEAFWKGTGAWATQQWNSPDLRGLPSGGGCSGSCCYAQPNCGFGPGLNTGQGEFYGLFQWLAEQIEKQLSQPSFIQVIQNLLYGNAACAQQMGATMCLAFIDNGGTDGGSYSCYRDVCSTCPSPNDNYVLYFNKIIVQVFPDPIAGYLTAIIAVWAEQDPNPGYDAFPQPLIPAHNTIDSSRPRPTSEVCAEARTCLDGPAYICFLGYCHNNRGLRMYTEGLLLRIRLQPIIQGSIVDVCVSNVDLDILGSDIDHPQLGCLADCVGEDMIENLVTPQIASAIEGLLHGNCPIPGTSYKDSDLSLCPKKPSKFSFAVTPGSRCSQDIPQCNPSSCALNPTPSGGNWGCCWCWNNDGTISIVCNNPWASGGGGCRHALFPIDLNEFFVTGRAFSISQYCGRQTTAQDPPRGHAHEDPTKCYPGPVALIGKPKNPWYGTLGCSGGTYDIGCYTYPHRLLLLGTGCSVSFDVGIRPKDLSNSCVAGTFPRSATLSFTNTSGFFPRPAFGTDNYAPYPFPNNNILSSWINNTVAPGLTNITPANRDEGSSTQGIGFTFWFFGNGYSDMCISTNGYAIFPSTGAGCIDPTPDPIPFAATPNNYVAPMWADLSGDDNEFLYYRITLPPLFVPRDRQTHPPTNCPANNRPCVAIGWSGEPNYYNMQVNTTEGNVCNNATNFDNFVRQFDINWDFPFYTQTTNRRLCIDSNGILYPRTTAQTCPGSSPTSAPIPNSASPNGFIAALWKDLDPAHGGQYQDAGCNDCGGPCPECEDGCINASCTTSDGISWFCHSEQTVRCNATYCPNGCTNCGTQRWCLDYDSVDNADCCPAGQDCSASCDANNNCTGTCYAVPGCRPSYDANCRIGPCTDDTCNCSPRTQHCHGSCILGVCTSCDLRCDSTGGAGGCYAQNRCCVWRNGGWECACGTSQTCQGGCEDDCNIFDPEPPQRQFRVLGKGYVLVGQLDMNQDGVPDLVDCPSQDIADGVFDDNGNGNYYDDDSAAANCNAIVITWYKITDYDHINDSNNNDSADCPGTAEDCCSDWVCSGGACSQCGGCRDDNRALCRLRQAGVLTPEPEYGAGRCANDNTFQIVLFSDGTIDINLQMWTNTNVSVGGFNARQHRVGIEDYNGQYGVEVPTPTPNVTYRFMRVGIAGSVCGPAAMQIGSRTDCPDTLNPGVSPNRSCRVIRWRNWHVKGNAICMDMYALLYNVGTGFNPGSNYDIVFYYDRFWAPIPGVPPAQQPQAARATSFPRTIGVENLGGTRGQYGFLPPDGTGVVMRYSGPFLYFLGVGISQDLLSDAAHMLYSSGLLCLASNPGGVLTTNADKFMDVSGFLPFNIRDVENLQYFFDSVRYLCDPDGQAEIRLIPGGSGAEPQYTQGATASARTGTGWPSLLTDPNASNAFPPGQFPVQPYPDMTFLLPSYAAEFWCRQNNISQFIKDGIVGATPRRLFAGYGDWFLALDAEYFVQESHPGWPSNPPSRVTQVLALFIDVKPQISDIVWNSAVPMSGRIGGISDILGDILSGYLQGMMRTRVSFPLSVTEFLHPLIRYIRPEGPDVTVEEFPQGTGWAAIRTRFPWVVTMPDYVAAYIGCVDFNQNGVVDPITECRDYSIMGTLTIDAILSLFGGGFLAPPMKSNGDNGLKISIQKPDFEVIIGDKRCNDECYIEGDEAKKLFGDINNRVFIRYSDLRKFSWRRNQGIWRIPQVLDGYSGTRELWVGAFADGENEISFFAFDNKGFGWPDIAKIKFKLDRVEPFVGIESGGEYDEKLKMRVFHSDKIQPLILKIYDNVDKPEDILIYWRVDGGEWNELGKGVRRLDLNLKRGVYKLELKGVDKSGNEGVWGEVIYVKGDEVVGGCPVIGSVTESDVKIVFSIINSLIPVSVVFGAFYIMKYVKINGNRKRNGSK